MIQFDIRDAVAVLGRTPETVRTMLHGLPEEWLHGHEGNQTWSPFVIVGHLVHGEETDWLTRTKIILDHGESKMFEPFDRFAQLTEFNKAPLNELLDRFAQKRRKNLEELKRLNIDDNKLNIKGKHPAFGTVTLSQLLAAWVVHDLDHIAQIARVLAKQYDAEVGPWKEYLRILNR